METLGAQAGIMMRCALEDSAKSPGARYDFSFPGGESECKYRNGNSVVPFLKYDVEGRYFCSTDSRAS